MAKLTKQAEAVIMRNGEPAVVLELIRQALPKVRKLVSRAPEDARHREMLAGLLCDASAIIAAHAGEMGEVLSLLQEARGLFEELARDSLISAAKGFELELRVASLHAGMGHGWAAVTGAQAAVVGYRDLESALGLDFAPNYARMLSITADILSAFGDPDIAVAAADKAIMLFMSQGERLSATADAALLRAEFLRATSVAEMIHRAHGRHDVADGAQRLGSHAADVGLYLAPGAVGLGRDGNGPASAGRLAVPGRVPTLRETRGVQHLPLTTTVATAFDAATSLKGVRRTTIQRGDLVRPPLEMSLLVPADRTGPEILAELPALAEELVMAEQQQGVRLALEACYLLDAALRAQLPAVLEQGPRWARLLLACSKHFASVGDLQMALDLSNQSCGVVLDRTQHTASEIDAVQRACREHADALPRTPRTVVPLIPVGPRNV